MSSLQLHSSSFWQARQVPLGWKYNARDGSLISAHITYLWPTGREQRLKGSVASSSVRKGSRELIIGAFNTDKEGGEEACESR